MRKAAYKRSKLTPPNAQRRRHLKRVIALCKNPERVAWCMDKLSRLPARDAQ